MNRSSWTAVLLVVVASVLLVSFGAERAHAGLTSVWAVDDGEKIFRGNITSPLKNGNSVWNGSNVSLSAAKNEIVAFQLMLQADGSGANTVNVTVSDLTNGGYTINGSHPLPAPNDYVGVGVELFTEHYLDVSVLSGDPLEGYFNWSPSAAPSVSGMTTGWMPDALVPFSAAQGKGGAPFAISANQNQGVWVDIYVDKGLPAGTYTGTITVTVNSVPVSSIPVSLQVLNFTLPDQNHYKSMIFYSLWDGVRQRYNLTDGSPEYWEMARDHHRMAHRHRLDLIGAGDWSPLTNIPGVLDGSAYTTALGYEGPGEGVGNGVYSIGTYGSWFGQNQSYFESESDAWVNWFNANAPGVDYFMYLYDEPGPDVYDDIKTRCDWIHNNPGPGSALPVLVTEQVEADLIGYLDIWCSATANWDSVSTAAAEARGEEVYSYAAHRPKTPSDVIDDWGIAYRLKPWIAYQWDVTRWFTWESTHYVRNWNEIDPNGDINVWVDPLTFHTSHASETGNGDGLLFYPGRDFVFPAQDRQYDGPVACYRLKMYRRGVQDYEYMWMAEQAGKGAEVQDILQDLLPHTMDNALTVPDWSNANAPYDEARAEVADLVLGTVRAPSARFCADKIRGVTPLTVNFTDLSPFNPTSWDWTFGDGGTSTAQNPSHTYSGSGSFTVSLTAGNAQGQDTEVKYDYISLIEEAVFIPDTWVTQPGWADAGIVSGGLSNLQNDDQSYMVMQPTNAEKRYSVLYTADTPYTASEVNRITMEYQAKKSSASTPASGLIFVQMSDYSWQYLGGWLMDTSDTDWTWDTIDPASYMTSNGIVGFEFCGCPNGTSNYTISSDVMRFRLELAGGGPVAPVAEFSGSPRSGTAPLAVNFTDLSTNSPTSWSWTFGDSGTSIAQNPSHQYTGTGNFTVSLTAKNSAGQDTETKTNYISVSSAPTPPVAEFSGNPTSGQAPLTVNFTDLSSNSPTSWDWSFGDSGTSTAQNPSHQYTGAGDYTVSLTAENAGGSDTETKTNYISVTSGGGAVTIFSDDFESSLDWTQTGDVTWYTGTPKNGTHSVRLRVTGSIEKTIPTSGYQNITVSFYLGAYSLDNSNENVQALWSANGTDWTVLKQINDGDPEEDQQLHYFSYSLPAEADENSYFALKFKLNGSGTGDYGYVDDVVVEGEIAPPSVPVAEFLGTPLTGQATLTVDFIDLATGSPTSWNWTFGDGGNSTAQNPSHDYTGAGDYTVSLTATNAQGNDTETKTGYVRVAPSGTPDTIYSDDFESGVSDWSTSGNVNWYSGEPSNGAYSAQLLKVGMIEQTISTAGYEYVMVSFYMGANSLDNSNENVEALWSDNGTDWVLLKRIENQDPEEDNQLHYFEYWLPASADDNASFALRFRINGSGTADYGYVDDVVVAGSAMGGPTPPVAEFSGNPTSGQAPLTVNFTDLSSNSPTSWDWSFGDSGTSTAQNPSHQYTGAGDYTVSLTAENAGGSDTETKTNYISVSAAPPPAPVAEFSGNPTSGQATLTVNFTDLSSNSPTSWDWSFGDSGTSTAQNPSHQYTGAGDYTVSLTAENAGGSDTETKTNYISVTSGGGTQVHLYPYNWEGTTLVSGSISDLTSDNNVYMQVRCDTGDQHLQNRFYYNTSAYPEGEITKITLRLQFRMTRSDTPDTWCTVPKDGGGSSIVQDWTRWPTTDTWLTWETTDVSGHIHPGGYLFVDVCGCPVSGNTNNYDVYVDVAEVILDIGQVTSPPVADFSGSPTSGVAPLSVSFTDQSTNSPTSWDWNFGDSGTSTAQNPGHQYTGAGDYTVSLTAENAGGSDTETKTNYISVTVPEVYVYPISWTSWAGVSLLSGTLADLETDDNTYMVYQCSTSSQQSQMEYRWDTTYVPADVSEITVELQWKGSRSDTPDYGVLIWNYNIGTWEDLKERASGWPTTDTWYTWNTTDVSKYLNSAGEMIINYCACPSTSSNYNTSIDVTRVKLTLN